MPDQMRPPPLGPLHDVAFQAVRIPGKTRESANLRLTRTKATGRKEPEHSSGLEDTIGLVKSDLRVRGMLDHAHRVDDIELL